jgi:hypothetical protein
MDIEDVVVVGRIGGVESHSGPLKALLCLFWWLKAKVNGRPGRNVNNFVAVAKCWASNTRKEGKCLQ